MSPATDAENGVLGFRDFDRQRYAQKVPIGTAGEFNIGSFFDDGSSVPADGEFRVTLIALGWKLLPHVEAFGEGAGALRRAIDLGLLDQLQPVSDHVEFSARLVGIRIGRSFGFESRGAGARLARARGSAEDEIGGAGRTVGARHRKLGLSGPSGTRTDHRTSTAPVHDRGGEHPRASRFDQGGDRWSRRGRSLHSGRRDLGFDAGSAAVGGDGDRAMTTDDRTSVLEVMRSGDWLPTHTRRRSAALRRGGRVAAISATAERTQAPTPRRPAQMARPADPNRS